MDVLKPRVSPWRRWLVLVASALGVVSTARLGFWQLDRAAQKVSIQSAMDSRRALPPLDPRELASSAEAAQRQHHRGVTLAGQWVSSGTLYLDNRQMGGRPGFYVITPLLLADGSAVLVQRGWQPRDMADRSRVVPPPTPPGPVQVSGRIAPPPPRLYEFAGAASGLIRQNVDVLEFGRELRLPLRPWSLVQLDGAQPLNDGLSRLWPTPGTGVEKHHGYAFQWFALSALILGLYAWFQLIRPRRQG